MQHPRALLPADESELIVETMPFGRQPSVMLSREDGQIAVPQLRDARQLVHVTGTDEGADQETVERRPEDQTHPDEQDQLVLPNGGLFAKIGERAAEEGGPDVQEPSPRRALPV